MALHMNEKNEIDKSVSDEINLLKKTKKGVLSTRAIKRILTVGSIVLSGILIFLSIELFVVGKIFQREMENVSSNIQAKESEIEDLKQREIVWRGVFDKLVVVEKLLSQGSYAILVFDQLTRLFPDSIRVDSIVVSESTLRAEVASNSLFDMEVFMEDLANPQKRGNLFSDVVVSSITQEKGGYKAIIEAKPIKQ